MLRKFNKKKREKHICVSSLNSHIHVLSSAPPDLDSHDSPFNSDHLIRSENPLSNPSFSPPRNTQTNEQQKNGMRNTFEQKDARVCAQLFCFDSASGYCVSYRPAAEGSSCGDGQVIEHKAHLTRVKDTEVLTQGLFSLTGVS